MRGAIPPLRLTPSWRTQHLYLHLKALSSRILNRYFGRLHQHHLALGEQISDFPHISIIFQKNVKFPWKHTIFLKPVGPAQGPWPVMTLSAAGTMTRGHTHKQNIKRKR